MIFFLISRVMVNVHPLGQLSWVSATANFRATHTSMAVLKSWLRRDHVIFRQHLWFNLQNWCTRKLKNTFCGKCWHDIIKLTFSIFRIVYINMTAWNNVSVWTDWYMMNNIALYNVLVQTDVKAHSKSKSLWPLFYGSVILSYILKNIWCRNMISRDNCSVWQDVWPQTNNGLQWCIFRGSLILPYVLKTIWCTIVIHFCIMMFDLNLALGHSDLYFMVH